MQSIEKKYTSKKRKNGIKRKGRVSNNSNTNGRRASTRPKYLGRSPEADKDLIKEGSLRLLLHRGIYTMRLKCNKDVIMLPVFVAGKTYEVRRIREKDYVLINEQNNTHHFSTDPNSKAYFGNWFEVVEEN